jgi:hypothetical protein
MSEGGFAFRFPAPFPSADDSAVPWPALRDERAALRERLARWAVLGVVRFTVGLCTTTGGSEDVSAVCANDWPVKQMPSAMQLVAQRKLAL